MSFFKRVAIETFRNPGEPSNKTLRARPLSGQGFEPSMRVECSSKMRDSHPAGTVFIIEAKIVEREGGGGFLYTHFNWPYEVVNREAVLRLISIGAPI
jgi:hypothetical protein